MKTAITSRIAHTIVMAAAGAVLVAGAAVSTGGTAFAAPPREAPGWEPNQACTLKRGPAATQFGAKQPQSILLSALCHNETN